MKHTAHFRCAML